MIKLNFENINEFFEAFFRIKKEEYRLANKTFLKAIQEHPKRSFKSLLRALLENPDYVKECNFDSYMHGVFFGICVASVSDDKLIEAVTEWRKSQGNPVFPETPIKFK